MQVGVAEAGPRGGHALSRHHLWELASGGTVLFQSPGPGLDKFLPLVPYRGESSLVNSNGP